MKVYCNIDQSARKFEGRTQIARKINEKLKMKGVEFVLNPKQADLIHFHSSGIFDSLRAYKIKKRWKKPCIFSLYSLSQAEVIRHFRNYREQKKITPTFEGNFILSYTAVLPLKLRGIFLKKLDVVAVSSRESKKKLFRNAHLVNIGINTKKFRKIKNKEKQKPNRNQKIKVGYFGHPSTTKGILDFIKASRYFGSNIEAHLFPSRLPKDLAKYAKSINKNIILYDYCSDITKSYNEMDIIVLPFRNKLSGISNPLVLLEAMACESAIVTTNLQHIKEIVGKSALKVDPYSPKKIARAVRFLSQRPQLRKELGENARRIVIERYDEEMMIDNYLQLYKKILRK